MVGDLLGSSVCEIRDNPSVSFAAVFHGAARAINASRQMHRLLQGFLKGSSGVRLGGCFILSTPEEGKLAELDVRGRLQSFAQDCSGQILLVGGVCKVAQGVPGLILEPLEEGTAGQPSILLLLPPAQWKWNTVKGGELWEPLPKLPEIPPPNSSAAPQPILDTTTWQTTGLPLSIVETRDVMGGFFAERRGWRGRHCEAQVAAAGDGLGGRRSDCRGCDRRDRVFLDGFQGVPRAQ